MIPKKFRAWDTTRSDWTDPKKLTIGLDGQLYWFGKPYNHDSFILMQFTGLTDKNGKEIWEGDVVVAKYFKGWDMDNPREILFEEAQFFADMPDHGRTFLELVERGRIKVIGNVWENPELLKP